MSDIDPKLVKELRERTGIQMMKCKEALVECAGDIEKAIDWLRSRGSKTKGKDRAVGEGMIGTYVHNNGLGVMVEVLCETDFVARNEEFKSFVHNLCLHIAASDPMVITREEIDPELVEREKEVMSAQIQGKPPEITEKILSGKLDKWFSQRCLLEQSFVKDDKVTVGAMLNQKISKLGENIVIRRFIRWERGEKI